jgi:erythronate-4-phosphate dehydrogenase
VVSGAALRDNLSADAGRRAVLDVWEHEPDPDPLLIERCALATPHIAGYSRDGKVTGVRMLHAALVRELGLDATELGTLATDRHAMAAQQVGADALPNDSAGIRDNDAERIRLRPVTSAGPGPGVAPELTETQWLHGVVKQMYDIVADDARMRVLLSMAPRQRAREFRELRRSYPVRRTFSQHVLSNRDLPAPWREQVTKGLQVSVH